MRHPRNSFACCLLFTLFVTPLVVRGQVVQQQQLESAEQDAAEQEKHRKIVKLAKAVIDRHERTENYFNVHSKNDIGDINEYTPEFQALSEGLPFLKPHDQALVLRAINFLTIDATAAVCSSAIEQHEKGKLSDEDWIGTLRQTSDLLPARMNEGFLNALEVWEQKYPMDLYLGTKRRPPPNSFNPYVISIRDSSFHELALKSKSQSIANSAFNAMEASVSKHWSQLEASAGSYFHSRNPEHRTRSVGLFSRLHPNWKGHLSTLKKLTEDPDISVARVATRMWLDRTSPNDNRRLLEALSADSDVEKLAALHRVDSTVTSDWGGLGPIIDLVTSGSADVRKAALEAVARARPHDENPFVESIKTDSDQKVRQFAIDRAPFRGWSETAAHLPDHWSHSASDSHFALLADARRDGLRVEPAMQKLTAPFGYRPQAIYDSLESGKLSKSKKLDAIARLLDADPSLKATDTAIASLREIIADNLAAKTKGYLGQARTAQELFMRHAQRLSPIVEDLSSFIQQTKSNRLVRTLPSFGRQAKPSLNLLIKILEDETGTWQDSQRTAIITLRGLQQDGKPALDALLKVAQNGNYTLDLMAALTYLDLGGDPAALMPKFALRLPVVAKIDPAKLVSIPEFKTELKSAVASDHCPYNLLLWLGPHADFLMPELKVKFKQSRASSVSHGGYNPDIIALLPLLPSSQETFVPICIEYLEQGSRSTRWRTALKTLAKIGDDQRLAESAVKAVMTSGGKHARPVAKKCYETLYGKED